MRPFFQAIRKHDLETVRKLLEKRPDLIACTAKQPPKKDDGQSPLQVALKSGAFEIAAYLLDLGADLGRIFRLLLESGMDTEVVSRSGLRVWEQFRDEPVLRFLDR